MPELPINTIIIIIICIAVFLAIASLFFNVWNNSYPGLSLEAAKNNACQMLASMGCSSELTSIPVNNFDANQDGNFSAGIGANGNGNWPRDENCGKGLAMPTRDNLATLCSCYYFKETAAACRSLCMCGTSGGGGGGCQEPPENTAPCDPTPCASPWICVNQNCQCP